MRILLVGHGRMGKLVASLAGEYGCEVAGIIDSKSSASAGTIGGHVDVAIDFSTPDAVTSVIPALARRGIHLVVGTTGWQAREPELRRVIDESGVGIVASANFSTGVVLFNALVRHAARLLASQPDFGAWLHEAHHAAKKDAPSGTALMLVKSMEEAGFTRRIDVSSTRAGYIPGTHAVGFDGPAESITLTHVARDRTTFARGALLAAHWIKGRRGWFTMNEVLGISD